MHCIPIPIPIPVPLPFPPCLQPLCTFILTARRERATVLIANLKASVVALYYQHRDWDQSDNYPASLGDDRSPWALKAKVS